MSREKQIEDWFYLYVDEVYNFLIYYLGHRDVEDIVQDVFIKVIRSNKFENVHTPKTYLFTIARNTAIDHVRKSKRFKWGTSDEVQQVPAPDLSPESSLLASEEHNTFLEHIKRLKRSYKDVLVLRLINELSFTEIADTLRWKEAKVKTTYYRAIRKLQEKSPELKEVNVR
ncbi:RNA polymerase sigma factor [Pontibacillus marinus]|uniref:RNA polymerase sigma factor n=1 Tax=Pontibacillus marinus BH030004 = DSM 16465 TaxID=1385511 RepID=A0A0A5GDT9_9BACI|nr:RNA polymerase sigma factor [Pontibacillus marinus]KGX90154.1 hypothetical protein N783_01295 [Pontibacillus marinus BH030004 = DSM 16465]